MINKFSTGSQYNAYEHAYYETVKRIECQSADLTELAKRTIGWIANAKSPLKVAQLEHALAIEVNSKAFDESNITDINLLSSYCCGLVTVDEQTGYVRLVHYTAQRYFEKMWEAWFPQIHEVITNSCLTYLSYDTFEVNVPQFENQGIQSKYPLLAYSARNWGIHFRENPGNEYMALQYLQNEAKVSLPGCFGLIGFAGNTDLPSSGVKGEHVAAFFGLHYLMQKLLETSPLKVQTKDDIGWTPLHFTARYGHKSVATLLIDNGANLEAPDRSGLTPLGLAAAFGQEAVVKLLLENGAQVESSDISGRTPLYSASLHGHETVAILLLDSGANIETSGRDGITPLRLAAVFGNETMTKMLLENGANIEASDERGTTALHIATRHGHDAVVKLLLGFDAKLNSRSLVPKQLPSEAAVDDHNAIVHVRDFPMFFVTP